MGRAVAGPPKRALERLPIVGGEVFSPASRGRTLEADAVVMATNTLGTRRIIAESSVPEGLARSVAGLDEADPFAVTRLWLAGEVPDEGIGFYTVGGHERLDSIAIYERLQRESRRWAETRPGSVVELHAYGIPDSEDRGVEGNSAWMLEEFHQRMPEWAGAEIVHSEVMQQRTFSGFAPGSHADRPGTKTGLPNLVFAGDWVRTDLPVALMEGAVTTGRLAANALLDRHGVRQATIETVSPRGPLA
jgi:isorenieratene synthase